MKISISQKYSCTIYECMTNSSADGTGGALVVHAPIFTNIEKRTEIGIDNQLLLCPPPHTQKILGHSANPEL